MPSPRDKSTRPILPQHNAFDYVLKNDFTGAPWHEFDRPRNLDAELARLYNDMDQLYPIFYKQKIDVSEFQRLVGRMVQAYTAQELSNALVQHNIALEKEVITPTHQALHQAFVQAIGQALVSRQVSDTMSNIGGFSYTTSNAPSAIEEKVDNFFLANLALQSQISSLAHSYEVYRDHLEREIRDSAPIKSLIKQHLKEHPERKQWDPMGIILKQYEKAAYKDVLSKNHLRIKQALDKYQLVEENLKILQAHDTTPMNKMEHYHDRFFADQAQFDTYRDSKARSFGKKILYAYLAIGAYILDAGQLLSGDKPKYVEKLKDLIFGHQGQKLTAHAKSFHTMFAKTLGKEEEQKEAPQQNGHKAQHAKGEEEEFKEPPPPSPRRGSRDEDGGI